MAKKKLNRKVALLGSAVFVFVAGLTIFIVLYLSRDPHKFIQDGDAAIQEARQTTDPEQQEELYKQAQRNYAKAYNLAKTDELKVETLHNLTDVLLETNKWRDALGTWAQIVQIEPKDLTARYNRLKYFYLTAQTSSGLIWQDVASQASEFIEMIERPGADPELATKDVSEWEVKELRQKGESTHRLGPYLHLIRGRATLETAQRGMVTNREEALSRATGDLEKVKQLEPANTDIYLYLAQAAILKGEIELSTGSLDSRENAQNEAIELLTEAVQATNDGLQANINLLRTKHRLLQRNPTPDQRENILSIEPDYLALTAKFNSDDDAFAALAEYYSDYRLGPNYLDKAIEAIEKACKLDEQKPDYALVAANLYTKRFNVHKQKKDLDSAIRTAKKALSLPDIQEMTGPRSTIAKLYQIQFNGLLVDTYVDQILDSTGKLDESQAREFLAEAQQAAHQIEQIFGSGDDPGVIKWQGMVELAAASIDGQDSGPAIRKLYSTYTQLKASNRSDPRLCYRLAKTFANTAESGAVGEFLADAILNGIEGIQPEARLDYTEILIRAMMWQRALQNIDLYELRCGKTDRSQMLRIRALIGAREFADAQQYLEQMPQRDPNWVATKLDILKSKSSQIRRINNLRQEKKLTDTIGGGVLDQEFQEPADKRSNEQLSADMQNILSAFSENMEILLDKDPDLLQANTVSSVCESAVAIGYLGQANLIIEKFLKYKPDSTMALFYKKLLSEPEPAKVSDERRREIQEEVLSGIASPGGRAIALGLFYETTGEPNKATEQFEQVAGISGGANTLQVDEMLRRRAVGYLFDMALGKQDWDTAENIMQVARQENLDDCSGEFFAARIAFAKADYETALSSASSALAQRPVFGYGYLLRSRINAALGNDAASLADIQMAARTNPFDKTIARELAAQLYSRNQKLGDGVSSAQQIETRNAIDRAMALNPGDLQLMSFYAEYISESEPNRALALRQSLQQNSPSLENALLLARLATRLALDNTGQRHRALLDMAASALDRARNYDPQNPAVLESYAEYYRMTDQQDKAEQLLKTTQEPGLLWRHYVKMGQYEAAKNILEQHYQADPMDIDTVKGLLYLAEKARDKDEVVKYADKLLSIEETADNQLLMIQTYLNTGLVKNAEQKLASFTERYPTDGRGLLLGTLLYMKQGRLDEALELVNKRLEGDQSDATAWQLRGQINDMLAEYDLAIADLKRSINLLDSITTRVSLARVYLKSRRTEDAITELKGIVDDAGAPDEARSLLERIYLRQKRTELLKDFYAKIISQLPDNVYWHNRAARFASITGDFGKAEQLYALALQKSKEQGQVDIDSLGGHLQALLDTGKIDNLFEEAGKYIDGDLAPVAYFRMAEGRMKLGDRATAVEYCRKAVDKTGNNAMLASQVLDKMYTLLGGQEVESLCQQMLASDPESVAANWSIYNLCRLKGDYNRAKEYIDKLINTVNPEDPQWLDYTMKKSEVLILAFNKTSDKNYLDEALQVYESILTKQPNNTQVLNNIAYILAENDRDLEKALEYAKRAYEASPDDPGYLDTYGFVLQKQGKYSEAVKYEQSAIQQYEARQIETPTEVYEHLGQSHEKLGQLPQARAAYEQALEAGGENMPKPVRERINTAIERVGNI